MSNRNTVEQLTSQSTAAGYRRAIKRATSKARRRQVRVVIRLATDLENVVVPTRPTYRWS